MITKPLALVFYEALLPGTQVVNRLQDLGYEVLTHGQASTLVSQARETTPFVVIVDLASQSGDVCSIIRELRSTPETAHIPVLAFAKDGQEELRTAAHAAGASLVAGDTAVLSHLPQLLDQVLEIEP
jgi:CheY-like chemotaxis protein